MVSWQTTTASLLAGLTVKQLVKREVSVEKLRQNIRALERLFPQHPAGFEIAHDHRCRTATRSGLVRRVRGPTVSSCIFPGGAYVARLPNMERGMMASCARGQRPRGDSCSTGSRPSIRSRPGMRTPRCLSAAAGPWHHAGSDCAVRNLAGGGLVLGVLMAIRDRACQCPPVRSRCLRSPTCSIRTTRRARASPTRVAIPCSHANAAWRCATCMSAGLPSFSPIRTCRRSVATSGSAAAVLPGREHGILTRRQPALRRARPGGRRVGRGRSLAPDAHGWQAMPFLPESDRAIERMGDFIRSSCP